MRRVVQVLAAVKFWLLNLSLLKLSLLNSSLLNLSLLKLPLLVDLDPALALLLALPLDDIVPTTTFCRGKLCAVSLNASAGINLAVVPAPGVLGSCTVADKCRDVYTRELSRNARE